MAKTTRRTGADADKPAAGRARFRTTILQGAKTATGIHVPDDVVAALGAGKRPPVRVTINNYTYRSTVAVMGGKFMLGVSATVREHAHVSGGDRVHVDLVLDTAPRTVTVPADFATALEREAKARRRFDELSYSRQQRLVLPIDQAKTPETRARRISKAIDALRLGQG
jgi:hypothetical protein